MSTKTKTTAKKKTAKKTVTKKTTAPAKKATATKQAAPAKKVTKKAAGRDAFGGRIGTRMSAINKVVIDAGKDGANVYEVAEKTGESTSIVSAQLAWMVSHKKVATRKEEKTEAGKKTFRYFAKLED